MDVLAEPPPLTPAAERIAAAADDLFYRYGIRVSGVDTIAAAAGTTKKTLYDRFGSKDALVALYLVRRARRWQTYLTAVLDRRRPGAGRVLAVFDAVEAWSKDATRGCAFINAYAEMAGTDHPGLAVIRAEKAWMRACFTELVTDVGIRSPGRVADVIHLLYEGALVAGHVGDDPHAVATARAAARKLLADQPPRRAARSGRTVG